MSYPKSPPFSYTALPDYNFDQTATYTNLNILLSNLDSVASAFDIEHEITDGTHKRITESPNLIMNSTARMGRHFWYDGGVGTDYDTGDTDIVISGGTPYDTPNFTPVIWTGAFGHGPLFNYTAPSGAKIDVSEAIPLGAGHDVVLSGIVQWSGYTAGSFYLDYVAFDSSDQVIARVGSARNGFAQTTWTADAGNVKFEATEATPTGTVYIRIRMWRNSASNATNYFRLQRLQIERGTQATFYDEQSSMPQGVSARAEISGTQSIATGTTPATIINFNNRIFEDPGTDRVTTGASWKFTADRYMKVRVGAFASFATSNQWQAWERSNLYIYKNGTLYSLIGDIIVWLNTLNDTQPIRVEGSSDIVELFPGDYIDIRIIQTSGVSQNLDDASWVAINEVTF